MSTSWNKFQKSQGGKGYTKAELSRLYKKQTSPKKMRVKSVGRVTPKRNQLKHYL